MSNRSDTPLLAAIDDYLHHLHHEKQASPHTCDNYARDLHSFADFLNTQNVSEAIGVDSQHVRSFISQQHRRGLGSRSLQRRLSSLRSFYNFLLRHGRAKQNPALGISAPKAEKRLPDVLDVDQVNQLLNIDKSDPLHVRDWAIMELTYSCGLRLSEVVNLNLDMVDLRDATTRVIGKGRKERILPIGRYAIEALQQWLQQRIHIAKADELALFVNKNGGRLGQRSIQQRLRNWAIKQGISQHVHPHMLRHSFASHILQSSGDLRAVQELLGHSDISTTQIYTHVDFQHLASVYDKAHPRARKKKKQD